MSESAERSDERPRSIDPGLSRANHNRARTFLNIPTPMVIDAPPYAHNLAWVTDLCVCAYRSTIYTLRHRCSVDLHSCPTQPAGRRCWLNRNDVNEPIMSIPQYSSHGTQPPPPPAAHHPLPRRASAADSVTLRHHRLARDASLRASPGSGPTIYSNVTSSPRRNSSGDSHETGQSDPKQWFDQSNQNPTATFDNVMDGTSKP